MDVLNFISWLKSKRQVTTVDASQTLIPVGLKDARRGDGYIPGTISVADLLTLSPGLPDFIEYNLTDKTVWNNGKSNITTNLSYGENALASINTGPGEPYSKYNTAIGYNALTSNTVGYMNTTIGCDTLFKNTTGVLNVAVGYESLFENTTGFRNIAVGSFALYNNTTGNRNVALGTDALSNNVSGVNNSVLGDGIQVDATGSYNCIIGHGARALNFNSSIVLGMNANATANNQFVVGSVTYNAGAIATEALTPTVSWRVKINGVDYKIPLQVA